LAEISHTYDASNTSTAHQLCILISKANGRKIVPAQNNICLILYSFTSPRIEKLKFSYFGTYEQSYMWVYIFSIIRTNVVFSKMLRPKAPHTPNQLGSNIFFH